MPVSEAIGDSDTELTSLGDRDCAEDSEELATRLDDAENDATASCVLKPVALLNKVTMGVGEMRPVSEDDIVAGAVTDARPLSEGCIADWVALCDAERRAECEEDASTEKVNSPLAVAEAERDACEGDRSEESENVGVRILEGVTVRVAPIVAEPEDAIEPDLDVAAVTLSDCTAESLAACEGPGDSLTAVVSDCPVIDALGDSTEDDDARYDAPGEPDGSDDAVKTEVSDAESEKTELRDIVPEAAAEGLAVSTADSDSDGVVDVEVVTLLDGSGLSLNDEEEESEVVSDCCADTDSCAEALCTSVDEVYFDTEICDVAVSVRSDEEDFDVSGERELSADIVARTDRVDD